MNVFPLLGAAEVVEEAPGTVPELMGDTDVRQRAPMQVLGGDGCDAERGAVGLCWESQRASPRSRDVGHEQMLPEQRKERCSGHN